MVPKNYIEKRYERYVPKDMREHLTWLERVDNECDHSHVYFVTFEYGGKEYPLEPCDTVDEIRWYSNQLKEQLAMPDPEFSVQRMKIYGYNWEGMLPMGRERARELMEQAPVYRLYPDGTEAMVESADDLANDKPGTLYGIEKEDWERIRNGSDRVINEDKIPTDEEAAFNVEIKKDLAESRSK